MGSGVDADLLDGVSVEKLVRSDRAGSISNTLTVHRLISNQGVRVNGRAVIDSVGRVKPSLEEALSGQKRCTCVYELA